MFSLEVSVKFTNINEKLSRYSTKRGDQRPRIWPGEMVCVCISVGVCKHTHAHSVHVQEREIKRENEKEREAER